MFLYIQNLLRIIKHYDSRKDSLEQGPLVNAFLLTLLIAGCTSIPSHSPDTNGKDQGEESTSRADYRPIFGNGDVFTGTDRRDAKTLLASAGIESYQDITDLRSTLGTDEYMLSLGITQSPDSRRTANEERNVTVGGFIYAIKKVTSIERYHIRAVRTQA